MFNFRYIMSVVDESKDDGHSVQEVEQQESEPQPTTSSELDTLLDKMLEIESTAHYEPAATSRAPIPHRDSSSIIESIFAEERSWTSEPPNHSAVFLHPNYQAQQHTGSVYQSSLEHLPYYTDYGSYLQQTASPSTLHMYGEPSFAQFGTYMPPHPSTGKNNKHRNPFEKAISNPEFYTSHHQYFGDIKKLGTSQSQSLPAFGGSTTEFVAPREEYTPSPEELTSPTRKSPPSYSLDTKMYPFSAAGPGPSGAQSQKLLKATLTTLTCAVCGDSAQCLHYGVRTCEGCKGFFKRSVQKKAKYVCLSNKDCVIDKRRRNRCQYCRFQKCLAVGMVKEVVRTDSLKGRRGRLPSKSKDDMSSSGGVSQTLTKSLVHAFTLGDDLYQQRLLYPASTIGSTTGRLVDSIGLSIDAVHQWTERIPGWASVSYTDRCNLLQIACVSILSLRICYLSLKMVEERRLIFDDGSVYLVDMCDEFWLPWMNSLVALTARIRTVLDEDLTAFCCLMALLLFMPENVLLESREECDKIKNNVINCLKEHCTYSVEAKTKPPQYFSNILALVNEIYSVGEQAKKSYAAYTFDPVQLPPNVNETFGGRHH